MHCQGQDKGSYASRAYAGVAALLIGYQSVLIGAVRHAQDGCGKCSLAFIWAHVSFSSVPIKNTSGWQNCSYPTPMCAHAVEDVQSGVVLSVV